METLINSDISMQKRGKWLFNSIEKPLYRIYNQCAAVYRINDGDGAFNLCPNCGVQMKGDFQA